MRKLFHVAALLALSLAPAHASAQGGGGDGNGRLVEQATVALPTHEQISDRFKRLYTREAVERVRAASNFELLRVRYTSDGLKVVGFIYKPKATAGRRLPAVIWNRGGAGGDALIGPANFFALHEMHRYASEGFVVLAPQYRGHDGGEGKDEVGGADTNDVLNIIELARTLPYVDMERLFMVGFSRGAVMTLQALRRGAPVLAARRAYRGALGRPLGRPARRPAARLPRRGRHLRLDASRARPRRRDGRLRARLAAQLSGDAGLGLRARARGLRAAVR